MIQQNIPLTTVPRSSALELRIHALRDKSEKGKVEAFSWWFGLASSQRYNGLALLASVTCAESNFHVGKTQTLAYGRFTGKQ
jgi:hypothetical protein